MAHLPSPRWVSYCFYCERWFDLTTLYVLCQPSKCRTSVLFSLRPSSHFWASVLPHEIQRGLISIVLESGKSLVSQGLSQSTSTGRNKTHPVSALLFPWGVSITGIPLSWAGLWWVSLQVPFSVSITAPLASRFHELQVISRATLFPNGTNTHS